MHPLVYVLVGVVPPFLHSPISVLFNTTWPTFASPTTTVSTSMHLIPHRQFLHVIRHMRASARLWFSSFTTVNFRFVEFLNSLSITYTSSFHFVEQFYFCSVERVVFIPLRATILRYIPRRARSLSSQHMSNPQQLRFTFAPRAQQFYCIRSLQHQVKLRLVATLF